MGCKVPAPKYPLDEAERLRALYDLNLLDSAPDERFDRLTRLAQAYFGTEMTLVTLIDAERQWFKSKQGIDGEETTREVSFCGHAILSDEVLVVHDATQDERFLDNPLVLGDPNVRFYAGAPIHAPNRARVGTLCLVDSKPRAFSDSELVVLKDLARCVDDLIATVKREHAASVLSGQESYLRSLLHAMSDAVLTIDAEGIIHSANPAATQMLAVPGMGDLRGQPLHQWRAEAQPGREAVWESQDEALFCRGDGGEFPAAVTVTAIEGGDGHRLVILRDISAVKSADRAKSEFISTVSHELRTPLTSIRGSLGLLLGGTLGEIPEKARRMLDLAGRNAERLTQLINDILDLEKITMGAMNFNLTHLEAGTALEAALAANEGYALRHGISLRLSNHLEGLAVQADELRLQQVFANLISNAVKFSPAGASVELSARREGEYIRFGVRDHGSGIPEHFRERIFQRFSQADSSDERAKGGTGLGLNIARSIVERHGGEIGFETSDAGTEFFFRLRAAATGDSSADILICEDNADVAEALRQVLLARGFTCDVAGSAGEADRLMARQGYRLMLLDLGLPDREGLEFLGELRRRHGHGLPVIVVSGREQGSGGSEATLGISAWLQKPVDPPQLLKALQGVLDSNSSTRLLHVEDDRDFAQVIDATLSPLVRYQHVATLAEARTAVANEVFDVVLLDIGLPDGDGAELIAALPPQTLVVVLSGRQLDERTRALASASILKGGDSHELVATTIKQLMLRGRT